MINKGGLLGFTLVVKRVVENMDNLLDSGRMPYHFFHSKSLHGNGGMNV